MICLDGICLDGRSLRPEDLERIALGARVEAAPAALAAMSANVARQPAEAASVLERKRRWLVGPARPSGDDAGLVRAFILGHCAGVGEPLHPELVRAAMAARANVLLQAVSGCRPEAALVLIEMLNQGVTPVVPSQGSVGAAGDLAPMAHIARVACGYLPGGSGAGASLTPFTPTPKEALALINGVSLTASLAALAVVRARRVLDAAIVACAMTMEATGADSGCIDPRPAALRGHAGGVEIAARLRALLQGSVAVRRGREVDAFSIRCAPAVLGAAKDALDHVSHTVDVELNGASDNPLLLDLPDEGSLSGQAEWVEAGNFHGASVALAMDHLRLALAQICTLSERRTFRLTYGQLTPGLPSFLVPGTGLNSGFMLAQYTAASLTSEVKGLAHPASVDSIPTVQHHEDHNSMGPIAARLALRSIDCAADVVGIEALLAAQALDLRRLGRAWDPDGQPRSAPPQPLAPAVERARAAVRAVVPFWEDDGYLHPALVATGTLVRSGALLG